MKSVVVELATYDGSSKQRSIEVKMCNHVYVPVTFVTIEFTDKCLFSLTVCYLLYSRLTWESEDFCLAYDQWVSVSHFLYLCYFDIFPRMQISSANIIL